MNTILNFLNTIFSHGWKKITFIFVMFLMTGVAYLTMFYYWNLIKQNVELTKQTYEQVQRMDDSNIYNKLYGIDNFAFEKSIKTKLMEHRINTSSNVVLFFGFHNGQRIGADFHAKRMSLISEDHAEYTNINAMDINTFNVALFAITIDDVLTQNIFYAPVTQVDELTMRSFMKSYNNYYIIATPIRVREGIPIGVLITLWDKFESENIKNKPEILNKYITKQKETTTYLEFKFKNEE